MQLRKQSLPISETSPARCSTAPQQSSSSPCSITTSRSCNSSVSLQRSLPGPADPTLSKTPTSQASPRPPKPLQWPSRLSSFLWIGLATRLMRRLRLCWDGSRRWRSRRRSIRGLLRSGIRGTGSGLMLCLRRSLSAGRLVKKNISCTIRRYGRELK